MTAPTKCGYARGCDEDAMPGRFLCAEHAERIDQQAAGRKDRQTARRERRQERRSLSTSEKTALRTKPRGAA